MERQIRRGVFLSVEELMKAIEQRDDDPKPFVWTAKAEGVLEKARHPRAVLENVK